MKNKPFFLITLDYAAFNLDRCFKPINVFVVLKIKSTRNEKKSNLYIVVRVKHKFFDMQNVLTNFSLKKQQLI